MITITFREGINVDKLRTAWVVTVVAAGLMASSAAWASLAFQTRGEMLKVWGKAEAGDVEALKAKLTPAIKTLVLGSISDGNWETGRDLGEVVEKAKVMTVVHGACAGWVCSMMFLSGEQRVFSAEGRAEVHYLGIPFIEGKTNYTWNGISENLIPEWLGAHTGLKSSDLQVYHASLFRASSGLVVDYLEFFPPTANVAKGTVLHCSGEILAEKKKEHTLKDCMPVEGATAINRSIVTSTQTYANAALKIKADIQTPASTAFARISEPIPESVAVNDDCKSAFHRFQTYDSPRAFVISDDKYCAWSNAQTFTPYASAMASCKRISKTGNCQFYAVDNQVVFATFEPAVVMSATGAGKPQE
jgi:hypothetical protein